MATADETAPLAGVILAGGRSVRMGADKAGLTTDGRFWLDRMVDLARPHCRRFSIAIRPDQADEPLRARYPQCLDPSGIEGPMAGILAGFEAHPGHALLVIACDLSGLDAIRLRRLVEGRDPGREVTALCADDGRLHPLCAIWEPSVRSALAAAAEAGERSPRHFLESRQVRIVEVDGLKDANRPTDLD